MSSRTRSAPNSHPPNSLILPTLYRYQRREYNAQLRTLGVLRVGTLYDFRRAEHRQGISDPSEGRKTIQQTVLSGNVVVGKQPEDMFVSEGLQHAFGLGPGSDVKVFGSTFTNVISAPDCFVLCFATELSARVQSSLGAESCLRIDDGAAFLSAVSDALSKFLSIRFEGCFHVEYQDKLEQWNGRDKGMHPALLKEPSFRDQREVRAIWHTADQRSIEPIVLGNHKLTQFCEWVDIPGQ